MSLLNCSIECTHGMQDFVLVQVGVSGDSNATADSAFFLRSPVYTESLNAVEPFVGANSLIGAPAAQFYLLGVHHDLK